MNDLILGIIIVIVALVVLTYIVLWSVRTINKIADRASNTTRQTLKELSGGR